MMIIMIIYCTALFSRGFSVESCIVVKHVGGDSENGSASPLAKKPCPDSEVCDYFKLEILLFVTSDVN